VFTPSTPIDFSSSFLSQLESSPESDYSRAQYTEKYIQERVAQELTKLEKEAIAKFQNTTDLATGKDVEPQLSVLAANEKITKLTDLLNENIKLAKTEIDDKTKLARLSVIECLRNNEGKTLNCWDEVENFKNLVKDL
jgi:altered-inheritance-of-mitochondria protein 13